MNMSQMSDLEQEDGRLDLDKVEHLLEERQPPVLKLKNPIT